MHTGPLPTFESFLSNRTDESDKPTKKAKLKETKLDGDKFSYVNDDGPVYFGTVGNSPQKAYTTLATITPKGSAFVVHVVQKGTKGKLDELGFADDLETAKARVTKWAEDKLVQQA